MRRLMLAAAKQSCRTLRTAVLTAADSPDEDGSKLHHKNVYGIDKPFGKEEKRKDGNYEMSWWAVGPICLPARLCRAPLRQSNPAVTSSANEPLWPLSGHQVPDVQVHEQAGKPQCR